MRYLIFLIVFLISYGSFFPFDFIGRHWSIELWHELIDLDKRTTQGDMLRNIFAFVPLGAVAAARFSEKHLLHWQPIVKYFLIAFIFSLLLQVGQLYLSSRIAALGDSLLNFVGFFIGFSIFLFVIQQQSYDKASHILKNKVLPFSIASCWLLFLMLPLYPLWTRSEQIFTYAFWWGDHFYSLLFEIYFAALSWYFWLKLCPSFSMGAQAKLLQSPPLEQGSSFGSASLWLRRLSFILLLLIGSVSATLNQQFEWVIAIFIGAAIAQLGINQALLLQGFKMLQGFKIRWPSQSHHGGAILSFMTILLIGIASIYDKPAKLDALQAITLPAQPIQWLPFAEWLQGNMMGHINFILKQIYLYACLLIALSLWKLSVMQKWLICTLLACAVEALQYFAGDIPVTVSEPVLVAIFSWAILVFEKKPLFEKKQTY